MALQVITLGYCRLGGSFDLHAYANKISLEFEAEDLNVTVFGDGWGDHMAGLKNGKLNVSGFNDFGDNLCDEVMYGFWEAGVNIAAAVRPSSASISTSNPEYQLAGVVPLTWTPLGADVGQVSPLSISWPTSGAVVRDVTP